MSQPDTIPREKVVQIAQSYRDLDALYKQQAAKQAELIRGCLQQIRRDDNHGTAHLGFREASAKRKKNREEHALVFLHLEWLVTQLENRSGPLTVSTEGEPPCSQA